jgi:hypothetical protein
MLIRDRELPREVPIYFYPLGLVWGYQWYQALIAKPLSFSVAGLDSDSGWVQYRHIPEEFWKKKTSVRSFQIGIDFILEIPVRFWTSNLGVLQNSRTSICLRAYDGVFGSPIMTFSHDIFSVGQQVLELIALSQQDFRPIDRTVELRIRDLDSHLVTANLGCANAGPEWM